MKEETLWLLRFEQKVLKRKLQEIEEIYVVTQL